MQPSGGGTGSGSNPLEGITNPIKDAAKEFGDAITESFSPKKIGEIIQEMEKGSLTIAKYFGQGRENVVALSAAMGDAAAKVKEMGGDFQSIVTIQKETSEVLGRNVILQGEAFEKLYATTEVTGQSAKGLIPAFKDAGFSVYQVSEEMKKAVDTARAQGVSAQAVSAKVVENMSNLNKYNFENGVQGLAKMAAQATALRIDMKSTFGLAEKLFSPEKAIEMAAAMQRLGVTQSDLLDPLRLMDLAQNDPAELQNQIAEMSKKFTKLNEDGTFELLPDGKRQLREIATAMDIPYDTLSKMAIAGSELDDKLSKIKFPADIASEEQKKMIANLAEMKGGEYVVTFEDKKGETVTKSVTELTKDDVDRLGEASRPKDLETIAKEQLDTDKAIKGILKSIEGRIGTALGSIRPTEEVRGATRKIAESGQAALGGEKLSNEELRKALGTGISELFKSFSEGNVIGGVTTSFVNLGKYMDGAFGESIEKAKKGFDELAKSENSVLKMFQKLGSTILDNENLGKTKIEETKTKAAKDFILDPLPDNTVTKAKAKDFVLETLPEDTIKIVGGKIAGGTRLGDESNTESKQNITIQPITMTIDVRAQGVNPNDVMEALKVQSVKEQIVLSIQQAINPNINPNQSQSELKNMALKTM